MPKHGHVCGLRLTRSVFSAFYHRGHKGIVDFLSLAVTLLLWRQEMAFGSVDSRGDGAMPYAAQHGDAGLWDPDP